MTALLFGFMVLGGTIGAVIGMMLGRRTRR